MLILIDERIRTKAQCGYNKKVTRFNSSVTNPQDCRIIELKAHAINFKELIQNKRVDVCDNIKEVKAQ